MTTGSGSNFDKRACSAAAKQFFVRGRECTLPDGDIGVFVEWIGKFQAKVFRGTLKQDRSGVFLVKKDDLLDINQDNYYQPNKKEA